MLKGAKATFADNTGFDTRLGFSEKHLKCMAPNQKIRLKDKGCKTGEIETRQVLPNKLICCEKEVGGPKGDENNLEGGGKKNLTMRNEIYNDNQLGEEIEKFRRKFKKYKKNFDEPLKQMMNKMSQYRLQQKSKLKDQYLTLFRTIRDDIKMAEDRKTTMEYEIFQKMSNKFKEEMKKYLRICLDGNLFTRTTETLDIL